MNVFPTIAYADLETAIHNAVITVWPGCEVKARSFRLGQSWWSKIQSLGLSTPVAYPGILFGGFKNSVEERGQSERGSGGRSPLVRGSGGSCNLVQEISFHIVKFSSFLVL